MISPEFNLPEFKKRIHNFENSILNLRDKVISDKGRQRGLGAFDDYNTQYDLNKFKQHFKAVDSEFEGIIGSRPNSLIAKFFDQRPHKYETNLLEVLAQKNDALVNDFIVANTHLFEPYSQNAKGDAYICAVKFKNDDLFNKLVKVKMPYKSAYSNKNIINYVIAENDLKRFKILFNLFEPELMLELKSISHNFFLEVLKNNSFHIFNYLMMERPELVKENLKRAYKPINKNGKEYSPIKSTYVDILALHDNQNIFETILKNVKFEMIFEKSKEQDNYGIFHQYINYKFNQFAKKQIELPRQEVQKLFALYDTKDLYTRTNLVHHILRCLPLPWNHASKVLLEHEKTFNSMVLDELLNALNLNATNDAQKFIGQTLMGKDGNLLMLAQVFLDKKYMTSYSDFLLSDDLILELSATQIEQINKILLASNKDKFDKELEKIDPLFSSREEIANFFSRNLSFIQNTVGTKIHWAQNEPYSHEGDQWLTFCNKDYPTAPLMSNEAAIQGKNHKADNQTNLDLYAQMIAIMEKKKLERATMPLNVNIAAEPRETKPFKL